jgi:hypothetical protein
MNEGHLRRLLRKFVAEYYHRSRTHLSLCKDCPDPRSTELPQTGNVVELPLVGGLHHRYTRRAAYLQPDQAVAKRGLRMLEQALVGRSKRPW